MYGTRRSVHNLLAGVLAAAGATALGFGGRAILKNRARRQQAAQSAGDPWRTGWYPNRRLKHRATSRTGETYPLTGV